jgi:hypothetical protein
MQTNIAAQLGAAEMTSSKIQDMWILTVLVEIVQTLPLKFLEIRRLEGCGKIEPGIALCLSMEEVQEVKLGRTQMP